METFSPPTDLRKPDMGLISDNFDKYVAEEDAYISSISKWAKNNSSKDPLVGETVRTPYADGYAIYVIAKDVTGVKGFCLIHVDVGDAWRDERFERLVNADELKLMVEQDKRFRR